MSDDHGMLLDSESYSKLTTKIEKELFIFQWLTGLEKTVLNFPRAEFKSLQTDSAGAMLCYDLFGYRRTQC